MKHCQVPLLLAGIIMSPIAMAQNKVVVIPMFEQKLIYTGVIKTGNEYCSFYSDGVGHWVLAPSCLSVDVISGQDGEFQAGAGATPRFVVNGDGTVLDSLTGLIWLEDAFCAQSSASWADALGWLGELNVSGTMDGNGCGDTSNAGGFQTDWRLPNLTELQGLLHFGYHGAPYLADTAGTGQLSSGDPFTDVQVDDAYWSSTTYGIELDDALRINFSDGVTDGTSKDALQHVWAVRGGL